MIIDNLVSITKGKLLQVPSVQAVTNLTSNVDKVTMGSAFFSLNSLKDDLDISIKNGAHAIIYENIIDIKDSEIAYIKVDSVDNAMIRVIRYELQRKEINIVLCSTLQLDMLRSFKLDIVSYNQPKSLDSLFALVFNIEPNSYLFFDDKNLLEQMGLGHLSIKNSFDATILQSHTLFRSTFVSGNSYFKEFFLTPLFIPEFSAIISFLEENSFGFKVDSMEKIGHFEPHFVNSNMEKKPFGSTNQAVIIETDESLFDKEADWLYSKNLASSTILLAPYSAKNISTKCKRYTSSEVLKTIQSNTFRYILILGDKEDIIKTLERVVFKNPSLF